MDLTIESFRPGGRERFHALMRQAFGGTQAFDPDSPATDPDKIVCAYDGDLLVGSVMTRSRSISVKRVSVVKFPYRKDRR